MGEFPIWYSCIIAAEVGTIVINSISQNTHGSYSFSQTTEYLKFLHLCRVVVCKSRPNILSLAPTKKRISWLIAGLNYLNFPASFICFRTNVLFSSQVREWWDIYVWSFVPWSWSLNVIPRGPIRCRTFVFLASPQLARVPSRGENLIRMIRILKKAYHPLKPGIPTCSEKSSESSKSDARPIEYSGFVWIPYLKVI